MSSARVWQFPTVGIPVESRTDVEPCAQVLLCYATRCWTFWTPDFVLDKVRLIMTQPFFSEEHLRDLRRKSVMDVGIITCLHSVATWVINIFEYNTIRKYALLNNIEISCFSAFSGD